MANNLPKIQIPKIQDGENPKCYDNQGGDDHAKSESLMKSNHDSTFETSPSVCSKVRDSPVSKNKKSAFSEIQLLKCSSESDGDKYTERQKNHPAFKNIKWH